MLPKYVIPEELTDGFEKFKKALNVIMNSLINESINEKKDELNDIYANIALNVNSQRRLSGFYSKRENDIIKIWSGFIEIHDTFRTLNETPLYLSKFPPNLPSKSRYLHSIITFYLNEVYILSQRLEAYNKKLSRLYRNNGHTRDFSKASQNMNKLLKLTFENINLMRGKHVHQIRYQDNDLESLSFLEYVNGNNIPTLNSRYKKMLFTIKEIWKEKMRNTNNGFLDVLDVYFGTMYVIVFDKNGEFIAPK